MPFPSDISNRNFLSPIGFKFTLSKNRKVDFFSNAARIPGINLGTYQQTNRFKTIDIPGGPVTYDDFYLSFMVDENLENYIAIHNWITSLGLAESNQRFKDLTTNQDGITDNNLQYSDGSLHILNSNYQDIVVVSFKDLYPVSLSSLDFTANDNDINYFTAEVSFKYTIYNILDANGNIL